MKSEVKFHKEVDVSIITKTSQVFKKHIEQSGGSFGDWSVSLESLFAQIGDTPSKYILIIDSCFM